MGSDELERGTGGQEVWRLTGRSSGREEREKRGKKLIGTTEDTKYLKFPNDSEGMSNWLVRQLFRF